MIFFDKKISSRLNTRLRNAHFFLRQSTPNTVRLRIFVGWLEERSLLTVNPTFHPVYWVTLPYGTLREVFDKRKKMLTLNESSSKPCLINRNKKYLFGTKHEKTRFRILSN
jgi:hypothetical protein